MSQCDNDICCQCGIDLNEAQLDGYVCETKGKDTVDQYCCLCYSKDNNYSSVEMVPWYVYNKYVHKYYKNDDGSMTITMNGWCEECGNHIHYLHGGEQICCDCEEYKGQLAEDEEEYKGQLAEQESE